MLLARDDGYTHSLSYGYPHPAQIENFECTQTESRCSSAMAPKATPLSTTNSGVRRLSNGESVIPASTRPDGSVRKEIRVKPGYKPPEDVEVYKNRTAEAWKNRGKGGVPGAQVVGAEEKEPPHRVAAKNARRREARKKAAAAGTEGEENKEGLIDHDMTNEDVPKTNGAVEESIPEEVDPEAEKAKEARKLCKKPRQARELKEKKDNGDSLLPEQFAKVIKMNELIRQLDSLGFDAEGEKKAHKEGEGADG